MKVSDKLIYNHKLKNVYNIFIEKNNFLGMHDITSNEYIPVNLMKNKIFPVIDNSNFIELYNSLFIMNKLNYNKSQNKNNDITKSNYNAIFFNFKNFIKLISENPNNCEIIIGKSIIFNNLYKKEAYLIPDDDNNIYLLNISNDKEIDNYKIIKR